MKKTAIAAALVLLTLTAAACGQKTNGTGQTSGTAAAETASVPETAAPETVEPQTEKAGGQTSEAAELPKTPEDFANQLKLVVKSKDLDGLIALSSFPVYISSVETNNGVVESIEEFAELDPAGIFTEEFMDAVIAFDSQKITETKTGYVLGDGTPNISFKEQDGVFKITGLNVR